MTANRNDAQRRLSRRSALIGTGGLVLGTGAVAGGATVLGDEDEKNERKGGRDDDRSEGFPDRVLERLRTEAFVIDADRDGALSTEMRLVGDPSGERRDTAVHVTSRGEESRDYVAAGIDLRDDSLTLADISDAGSITYDYYKGAETTHRVPDEAFLFLRTGPNRFAAAFRGADDERTDTWETRDVSNELTADGWRAAEIDLRRFDLGALRGVAVDEISIDDVGGLLATFGDLESVSDLTGRFSGDAAVLGMGIGVGSLGGAVSHAYYNGLRVAGEERAIPAAVAMEPSFSGPQGRGRITASLSLTADDQLLSASDVDPDSVRLAPYSPVTPPIPGTPWADRAVAADSVDVSSDAIEAEFVPGQVRRLLDGDSRRVVVYGDFDVDEPYTFAAVGDLEGNSGN